jgi:predicted deacylase
MKSLAMISPAKVSQSKIPAAVSHASSWLRASEGGLLRTRLSPGDRVKKGQRLGEITDPFGVGSIPIMAEMDGIIIGRTNLPIVHKGDALLHIARTEDPSESRGPTRRNEAGVVDAPSFDEDAFI